MDARAKTVREIVQSENDQYLVPFFQRHYSWKRPEWKRLWEDLLALPKADTSAQHFMGSLVCTPSDHVPGEVTPYQLIDGQQRLTTITILLAALRDVAKSNDLYLLHEEVTENYLIHKRKKGLDRYRLLPRIGDREVLCDMIDGVVKKEEQRNNMVKALGYFKKCLVTVHTSCKRKIGGAPSGGFSLFLGFPRPKLLLP